MDYGQLNSMYQNRTFGMGYKGGAVCGYELKDMDKAGIAMRSRIPEQVLKNMRILKRHGIRGVE